VGRAGGILRTQEAKAAGIHPRTLAALVEDGTVLRLDRGVYQLADAAPSEPDLAVPRSFKDSNKIGKANAIEALRTYLRRKDAKVKDLLHFARINRVQAVMAPYVDVLLAARS